MAQLIEMSDVYVYIHVRVWVAGLVNYFYL